MKEDKRGFVTDDIGRPVLQLRKHDIEIGWFNIVAQRNGVFSQERQQAKILMDKVGQLYWPDVTAHHTDRAEASAKVVRNAASA